MEEEASLNSFPSLFIQKKKKVQDFFCVLYYQVTGIQNPPGKVTVVYKIMTMFLELL